MNSLWKDRPDKNMGTTPPSRNFTIRFPESLARQADLLAEQESRNTSELFREAFLTDFATQMGAQMVKTRESAGNVNPANYRKMIRAV